MTPKEQAKKLYEDFIVLTNCVSIEERDRVAKKCCFITINELIKSSESYDRYNATWASQVNYWNEVLSEVTFL